MTCVCCNCKSTNVIKVDSYKHFWYSCNDCKVVFRERRSKYPLDTKIARILMDKFYWYNYFQQPLFQNQNTHQDEKTFYNYYYEVASKGIKGTKWESANAIHLNDFKRHNIEVKGKSILNISGGPGFLTEALKPIAQKSVLTEFSEYAVEGIKKALNVEAKKFDYNSDCINSVFTEKFDVILILYSIGFCNDIKQFVEDLKGIVHKGTVVYITYSLPSLGLMMRWQFDDYPYTRAWPDDIVRKSFETIGMKEVVNEEVKQVWYSKGWFNTYDKFPGKYLQRFNTLVGNYYVRKAKGRNLGILSDSLHQKTINQIFRFV